MKRAPDAIKKATSAKFPRFLGTLDLVFAGIFVAITALTRSSNGHFETANAILAGAMLVAGVAMWLPPTRAAWWAALVSVSLVLLAAFVLMALLISSAAFLWGTFGALGKGAASMALVMAALVLEVYVLLPAIQLWYLLRTRARFGGVQA